MQIKLMLVVTPIVAADRKSTVVLVKAGPLTLYSAKLGGVWNQKQTLNELKNQPQRFVKKHPDAEAILRSLGA